MKKYKNPEMLSSVVYFLSRCLHTSLRIQKFKHPTVDERKPAIYCFWHGHLYLPIITVKKILQHPAAGFVSYSKDGEILARWLEKMGYSVVRGSSSKKGFAGM
ncbi:MAG TPA: DUF374 domain-containing protein, partial [Gammaproteobacteria bacterium]|nr:DUF374 domain-containing protein [Gammaproteobacteria bacterium]